MTTLHWPIEAAQAAPEEPHWLQAESNICLDFHGDPLRARLVLFSDGNHHMALEETLQAFVSRHPKVADVFYVTTPPAVLLQWLSAGCLHVGNLRFSLVPHAFISPPQVLERVVSAGRMESHCPFMRSRGNVLLVLKGNQQRIRGIADLAREDVRIFLSNPTTEAVSYQVYRDTLVGLARREEVTLDFLDGGAGPHVRAVYSNRIHHREAPLALAAGQADAAVLYYHLALRYMRAFPDLFEIVPLGGTADDPRPTPENIVSHVHTGLVGDGGAWGAKLLAFLGSDAVTEIYARHGMLRLV